MGEKPLKPEDIVERPAVPGPAASEVLGGRYGADDQQLLDSDHVVRKAVRDRLIDVTTQCMELRAQAATPFSGSYPSRISAADREGLSDLAPSDDLVELETNQLEETLPEQRSVPAAGRLRQHFTPRLLELTDATDEMVGRISMDALPEQRDYRTAVATTETRRGVTAEGRNPLENELVFRWELKRSSIYEQAFERKHTAFMLDPYFSIAEAIRAAPALAGGQPNGDPWPVRLLYRKIFGYGNSGPESGRD